jgi:hypothetical protein
MIKNGLFVLLGITLILGYFWVLINAMLSDRKVTLKHKIKIELVIANDGQEFYVLVNKNNQPISFIKK